MATTTMIDYRRQDQIRYSHLTPYWIRSLPVYGPDADDLAAVVFSFPDTVFNRCQILIHDIGFEVTTAYAGGTVSINVGACTLATDDVTTDGDTTDVDADEYVPTADITEGSAALYWAATGDFITQRADNIWAAPALIAPADATVPCIAVYVTSDATITAGYGRVVARISEVPLET